MFDPSFLAWIYAKFSKNQTFFIKIGTKFSPLSLNVLEADSLKLWD